jgi:hypothetical protein
MKAFKRLGTVLVACALAATGALAQLNVPRIVQLPTQDFVWNWGTAATRDRLTRPDFELKGIEDRFHCSLTGAFKPGSHRRDFYELRNFEQSLSSTLYFIEDATSALNDLYLSNDLQWAKLDCAIPDLPEDEEKQQERVDKALERAERERARRRAREDQSEN